LLDLQKLSSFRVFKLKNLLEKLSISARRRMSSIDFILNIAGLLLWLNWRAIPWRALPVAGPSLAGTIKPAGPSRPRWVYLLCIVALVFLRTLFYWQAGPQWHWAPRIALGPIILSFRSDLFPRMLLFSCLSFGASLGIFYACLLLLSWINTPVSDADPGQRLVRLHLGWMDHCPNAVKLLLPLLAMVVLWCALYPLLHSLSMVPKPFSPMHLVAQGAVAGLSAYLALKFMLLGVLTLYLVNSYVFLGDFPFWNFVNNTAHGLLRPLRPLPLRIGRVDLAPALAIALIVVGAEFARRGLGRLYLELP
jgi:uncharacterized protein YggT (Ycf19 family)